MQQPSRTHLRLPKESIEEAEPPFDVPSHWLGPTHGLHVYQKGTFYCAVKSRL